MLVEQLWQAGVQIDDRARKMGGDDTLGNLVIETHEGERFAALLEGEHFERPWHELLPRLWGPVLVDVHGGEFRLRGVQRSGGRLCHQEWRCSVLKQTYPRG